MIYFITTTFCFQQSRCAHRALMQMSQARLLGALEADLDRALAARRAFGRAANASIGWQRTPMRPPAFTRRAEPRPLNQACPDFEPHLISRTIGEMPDAQEFIEDRLLISCGQHERLIPVGVREYGCNDAAPSRQSDTIRSPSTFCKRKGLHRSRRARLDRR
jgi:hypothetical protein